MVKDFQNNIFSKIIKGEIVCNKVFESDTSFAFYDINPRAKIHVLVLPKRVFVSSFDFFKLADKDYIKSFFTDVIAIVEKLEISSGYRLITNHGEDGGQEIDYFHIHILGGEKLR